MTKKLGPEFYDPSDEDILRIEQKWLARYLKEGNWPSYQERVENGDTEE